MIRHFAILLAGATLSANAAAAQEETLRFVACPVVKDTPSVPCWLSEYEGELYYMGVQSDVSAPFNPPFLGHKALVEGTPDPDGTRICGGIVLEPVKVSVIPEMAPECDQMIPAEPGYILPFEPRRPPGPSSGRLAFSPPPPPPVPQPPYEAKAFDIFFPFESSINFQTPGDLAAVQTYAEQIGATKIEVIGQRNVVQLSNGQILQERDGLAQRRATEVAAMFDGLIPSVREVEIQVIDEPVLGDWRERKVRIIVSP